MQRAICKAANMQKSSPAPCPGKGVRLTKRGQRLPVAPDGERGNAAPMSNRGVALARRPRGMVRRDDFAIEDRPLPEPGAGDLRVRIAFISLDPAMRGWMAEGRSYAPPVGIGEVSAAGSVVAQIAQIKGCRGKDKCRHVTQELGFDACVD
jgi:NADPH-dependent curcumin reductase CurA